MNRPTTRAALSALALAATLGVTAAEPIVINSAWSIDQVPEIFSDSKEPTFYIDEDKGFKLFDGNFNSIGSITIAEAPEIEVGYVQYYKYCAFRNYTYSTQKMNQQAYEINGNSVGLTAQDVYNNEYLFYLNLAWSPEQIPVRVMQLNDGTAIVYNLEQGTYSPEQTGIPESILPEAPRTAFVPIDGKWYFCEIRYEGTDPVTEGDWQYYNSNSYKTSSSSLARLYYSNGTFSSDRIYLTQTLFNDDNHYEYIIDINEVIEKEREYTSEYNSRPVVIKTVDRYAYPAAKRVVNELGQTVAEIKAPTGMHFNEGGEGGGYVFISKGKKYLTLEASSINNNEDYVLVYAIGETGAVTQVAAERKVRVSPTTPIQGQEVLVDLGDVASAKATVTVVAANGQQVGNARVAAGERQVSLDTSRLAPGLYIVNVTDGATTREATKIIVR